MVPGPTYGDLAIASGVNPAVWSCARPGQAVVLLETPGCGGDLRANLASARA